MGIMTSHTNSDPIYVHESRGAVTVTGSSTQIVAAINEPSIVSLSNMGFVPVYISTASALDNNAILLLPADTVTLYSSSAIFGKACGSINTLIGFNRLKQL